jgi:hypothetical protein
MLEWRIEMQVTAINLVIPCIFAFPFSGYLCSQLGSGCLLSTSGADISNRIEDYATFRALCQDIFWRGR